MHSCIGQTYSFLFDVEQIKSREILILRTWNRTQFPIIVRGDPSDSPLRPTKARGARTKRRKRLWKSEIEIKSSRSLSSNNSEYY